MYYQIKTMKKLFKKIKDAIEFDIENKELSLAEDIVYSNIEIYGIEIAYTADLSWDYQEGMTGNYYQPDDDPQINGVCLSNIIIDEIAVREKCYPNVCERINEMFKNEFINIKF